MEMMISHERYDKDDKGSQQSVPDEDDTTPEAYDQYLNVEVVLPTMGRKRLVWLLDAKEQLTAVSVGWQTTTQSLIPELTKWRSQMVKYLSMQQT